MNKHWVWVLTAASAACAAPTETSSTVGYVLLDRDARAAGTLTVGGYRSSPRLPVAADGADQVEFTSGDEAPRAIAWQPQKLAYLHGPTGEIEWIKLGRDARPDALLLNGDATAADAVASLIGVKATRGQDGLYRIASSDIYFKLAFSGEPDSLVEAFPEYLPLSETSRSSAPHVFNADELMPLGREEGSRRGAELVGLYRFGERLLVLDASGHYTLEDDAAKSPTGDDCAGQKKTSGVYRPVRGGVVLDDAAGVIALSTDGETLVGAEGQRFAPLVAETPQQAKRQVGLLHQVDEDGDEP
jgi:hypothetical protein